jgi:hypothetical protein
MRRLTCLASVVALSSLIGCTDEYSIDFRYLTMAPPEVVIDSDHMEIPEGVAVGVEAVAVEDGDRIGDLIDFVPVRPGIIGIDRGLDERTFVIYGMAAGATSIDLYFNNERVGEMPAEVVAQHVSN